MCSRLYLKNVFRFERNKRPGCAATCRVVTTAKGCIVPPTDEGRKISRDVDSLFLHSFSCWTLILWPRIFFSRLHSMWHRRFWLLLITDKLFRFSVLSLWLQVEYNLVFLVFAHFLNHIWNTSENKWNISNSKYKII